MGRMCTFLFGYICTFLFGYNILVSILCYIHAILCYNGPCYREVSVNLYFLVENNSNNNKK